MALQGSFQIYFMFSFIIYNASPSPFRNKMLLTVVSGCPYMKDKNKTQSNKLSKDTFQFLPSGSHETHF